jgi:hypothetical protein
MKSKKQSQNQSLRREETTGKGNPELVGESPHSTPGQTEGNRQTEGQASYHHRLNTPKDQDDLGKEEDI